ncbi:hypothetical protein DV736_g5300, partial [Chaetothyriales sp. CBS 134916]
MEWKSSVDIWNVAVLVWDLFENRHLFHALDENKEMSATHHVAEMVGYLGTPPFEYIERSEVTKNVFDEQGHWKGAGGVDVPRLSLEGSEKVLDGDNKERFLKFMRSMLKWLPEERKRASELLKDPWLEGNRPQGIRKAEKRNPVRRSTRLDRLIEVDETHQKTSQQPLLSPVSDIKSPNRAHPPSTLLPWKPSKRKRETEQQLNPPYPKRQRTSPRPSAQDIDSITYWTRTHRWPRGYFNESGEMSHLLARKKSAASLRRKRSDSESGAPSSTTPSDQKPREEKSAPYQDLRYRSLLESKGSFIGKYVGRNEEGPTAETKKEYKSLLEAEQAVPEHSLFQDDFFEETCEMIQDRNEAKVIQDIARLIVPSAQSLAVQGAKHLRCLIESVNEGWNNSIPVTKTRPQPDYSVGFKRSAFTEDQLKKLQPFVGDLTDNSFFMGTWYMYFPFFSSEVKCGAAALDVADRQNAHSMTLAV